MESLSSVLKIRATSAFQTGNDLIDTLLATAIYSLIGFIFARASGLFNHFVGMFQKSVNTPQCCVRISARDASGDFQNFMFERVKKHISTHYLKSRSLVNCSVFQGFDGEIEYSPLENEPITFEFKSTKITYSHTHSKNGNSHLKGAATFMGVENTNTPPNHRGNSNSTNSANHQNSILLTVNGSTNQPILDFLNHINSEFNKENDSKKRVDVFVNQNASWYLMTDISKKRLSSICLDVGVLEKLTSDITWFCENRQWYADRCIPYKRSYIFYGPPGCGKSSLVIAIASTFKKNLNYLSLSDVTTDDQLRSLFVHTSENSIVVLEDIDAATGLVRDRAPPTVHSGVLQQPGDAKATVKTKVTFSALLNVLDGAFSREGIIVIFTSNHIDHLDPALLRPGRCDFKLKLDLCSRSQLGKLFFKFYGVEISEDLRDSLPDRKISPAQVVNIFQMHRDSSELALKELLEF